MTKKPKTQKELLPEYQQIREQLAETPYSPASHSLNDVPAQSGPDEEDLHKPHDELEARVLQRTSDLARINQTLQDEIIQRKRTEEALRESEARFRTIFENAAIGMALVDLDGHTIEKNPALLGMFGCSDWDLSSTMLTQFAFQDGGSRDFELFQQLAVGNLDRYEMEKRYMRKDGQLIWCHMTVSLIRDAHNEPHSAVVMLLNISERKKTEKALKQSEARYRAIVEDQTELVSRFLPDYTITFVNDAYCRYFGESREDLIGGSFWHYVPKKGRERLLKHFASLTRENPVAAIEHRFIMPGCDVRWQQWTDRAIFDERGRIKEIQSVGRDITKQKRAEEALRQSEKRLRRLSSQLLQVQEEGRQRIAQELHDSVGQYLSAIKYGLENSLQVMNKGEAANLRKSLEAIIPITKQAIEEVRRLYMELRPSILDDLGVIATINWFCREFEKIYAQIRITKQIDILEEEVPEPLKIIVFRILQEALNNVAKHSQADSVRVSLCKNASLELTIEDNGRGFDPQEAVARKNSEGGVGLASMKERAILSGGNFAVDSIPGYGTTVGASWPLQQAELVLEETVPCCEKRIEPIPE